MVVTAGAMEERLQVDLFSKVEVISLVVSRWMGLPGWYVYDRGEHHLKSWTHGRKQKYNIVARKWQDRGKIVARKKERNFQKYNTLGFDLMLVGGKIVARGGAVAARLQINDTKECEASFQETPFKFRVWTQWKVLSSRQGRRRIWKRNQKVRVFKVFSKGLEDRMNLVIFNFVCKGVYVYISGCIQLLTG